MMRRRLCAAAWVLFTIGMSALVYYAIGQEIYVGVWGDDDRATGPDLLTIKLFTSPAEGRVAQSAVRVRVASVRAGFRLSLFDVRVTNALYELSWRARRQSHTAGYVWGTDIVLADRVVFTQFTDSEMDCVMAHEVGHILQFDEGYLATLDGPAEHKRLVMELDADRFAASICGEENWAVFFKRHIGTRAVIAK